MSAGSPSLHARIAGGALLVAALTALVRLAMLAREVVVAATYGRGDALEAFLVAVLAPMSLGVALGSALHLVAVPTLTRLRRDHGAEAALAWERRFTVVSLMIAIAAALALAAAAPLIVALIAPGFAAAKLELAERLAVAAAPLCVTTTAYSLISASLNADSRLAGAAILPAVTPLLTLAAVIAFGQARAWPLLGAAVIGGGCECVAAAALLRRPTVAAALAPAGELSSAWRQVALAFAGMLLQMAIPMVDQAFAARLESGSVSAVGYATRLALVPTSLAAAAIATAINPVLGRLAGDHAPFWSALRWWNRRIVLVGAVAAVVIAVLAEPLVGLVLQHGSFSGADTATVAALMRICLGALPFYVLSIVGMRALAALRLNHVFLRISAVNLLADVLVDALLVPRIGVTAIAIANVAVYAVFALQVVVALRAARRREAPATIGEPASAS
jgi:putative peptidoglycan lipid II flippase